MKILTTPWKKDLFRLVKGSKQSIKITSPFITYEVCDQMLAAKNNSSKLQMITAFRIMSVYSGLIDLAAIERILSNEGTVKTYPRLHSKIYVFDNKEAVITSGNLTAGGLEKNFEYGIHIDDRTIVETIVNDFDRLYQDDKTGEINQAGLDMVKKIINRLPKYTPPHLPAINPKKPDEILDVIETPLQPIVSSLSGWTREVFKCADQIPKEIFTLDDIYKFERYLRQLYPSNRHIQDKIRQQLQSLRDIGLLEFLGQGRYRKLWRQKEW